MITICVMKLNLYIEEMGDAKFAKALKVSERRVSSWRLGQRIPRGDMAVKIHKLTIKLQLQGKSNAIVTVAECFPGA